jgi:hypothetical protein
MILKGGCAVKDEMDAGKNRQSQGHRSG